jgi:hypothetical protein
MRRGDERLAMRAIDAVGRGRSAETAWARSPETAGPSMCPSEEPRTRWLEACKRQPAEPSARAQRRDALAQPRGARSQASRMQRAAS